ncbi:MAG: hypothetical protein Kow00108_03710 [Calditrichia bacterium]
MITADTTIEEIVERYPELIKPLREFGIKCIVCGEPIWGTLHENAREKQIPEEKFEQILRELNRIIDEKR